MEPRRRSLDDPGSGPAAPLRWPLEALWARLEPLRPRLSVELLVETDSTSTRLLERARNGDTAPCLLVAERQTAARGRHGRPWFEEPAEPGSGPGSLCFSLGLALQPTDWSGLSLAVGVALAEALHPSVRLKWPNDLWLGEDEAGRGRKLGGILIETLPGPQPDTRHAVIGVGINLATPAPRAGLDGPAAGWRELEPQARAPELLARVAAPLLNALNSFEAQGFAAFAARYAARDALAGRRVRTGPPEAAEGIAEGVDADGALLLRSDAGLRRIASGEVSVRPC